jgi:hypothetical protein
MLEDEGVLLMASMALLWPFFTFHGPLNCNTHTHISFGCETPGLLQSAEVGAQLATRTAELSLATQRLTSRETGLETSSAEAAARGSLLADVTSSLVDKQRQLAEVEEQLRASTSELAASRAEVARHRADSATRDVTLASELRGHTAAEHQRLEDELKR